jgi:DNA-binding CsgD family transcriptional regulator/PAS domain-containing protein
MGLQLDEGLLGQLYRTPDHDQLWRPLLDELSARFGARNAAVQLLRERGDRLEQVWLARDSLSEAHAQEHDRWLSMPDNPRMSFATGPQPELGCDSQAYGYDPQILEAIHASLATIGLGAGFWVGFSLGGNRHFSMILHRPAGDYRDMDADEEAFLKGLLPHLKQSVRLSLKLRDAADEARYIQAATNQSDQAMLACDDELQVLWCNQAAEYLLARSAHLSLRQGRLWAQDRQGMKLLHDLAKGHMPLPSLLVLGQPGDNPLQIKAAPAYAGAMALVLAEPERACSPMGGDLMHLFGLTGAEAQLAAALATGSTLQEYADQREVSVGTLRVQLKQVLAKTGAGRQADLVRILGHSIAMRTRRPRG